MLWTTKLAVEVSLLVKSYLMSLSRVAVAKARGEFVNQRKGNIRHWKPLPSNDNYAVTAYTSVFVLVKCFVASCIKEPNK
jgi:hypothetical protein